MNITSLLKWSKMKGCISTKLENLYNSNVAITVSSYGDSTVLCFQLALSHFVNIFLFLRNTLTVQTTKDDLVLQDLQGAPHPRVLPPIARPPITRITHLRITHLRAVISRVETRLLRSHPSRRVKSSCQMQR